VRLIVFENQNFVIHSFKK